MIAVQAQGGLAQEYGLPKMVRVATVINDDLLVLLQVADNRDALSHMQFRMRL